MENKWCQNEGHHGPFIIIYLLFFNKKMYFFCVFSELPFGWEKVEDPHFGVYYIE